MMDSGQNATSCTRSNIARNKASVTKSEKIVQASSSDFARPREDCYTSIATSKIGIKMSAEDNTCSWKAELKHLKLEDLKNVTMFSVGSFGQVSVVQVAGHPDSAFALKTIKKSKLNTPFNRKSMLAERRIMEEVQSDFIVKLYKTFKDKKRLYMLMEYCPGGTLLDWVPVSDTESKFYVACVLEALDYLHTNDISYNDLKTENLVLDSRGYVKLIDFGCAEKLKNGEKSTSICGSPVYWAPEIARHWLLREPLERDRAVDLWSLGILVYEFIHGSAPFSSKCHGMGMSYQEVVTRTAKEVLKGMDGVDFDMDHVSEDARDLIRNKLCRNDPALRLGYIKIEDIRHHKWFDGFDWTKLRSRSLKAPIEPMVENCCDTLNFISGAKALNSIEPDSDSSDDDTDPNWDEDF